MTRVRWKWERERERGRWKNERELSRASVFWWDIYTLEFTRVAHYRNTKYIPRLFTESVCVWHVQYVLFFFGSKIIFFSCLSFLKIKNYVCERHTRASVSVYVRFHHQGFNDLSRRRRKYIVAAHSAIIRCKSMWKREYIIKHFLYLFI